jgi:TolB-like protein
VVLRGTTTDHPLWSGKFDRELTDVFVIQDEISRGNPAPQFHRKQYDAA